MRPLCASPRPPATPRTRSIRPVNLKPDRARIQRQFGDAFSCRSSLDGNENKASDAYYSEALSKARDCIFSAPDGQLLGRAGRRCTLEDGERHASRAVSSRPTRAAEARLLLARSLVAQSRGREIEVPRMVVEALRITGPESLDLETAVALVEAAGVAFEKGAGATTGFASVELFAKAVSEAAEAQSKEIRQAAEAAAAAVAARTEVARQRAQREAAVERAQRE